jgi:Skp family chaperone for outer membrane proteins
VRPFACLVQNPGLLKVKQILVRHMRDVQQKEAEQAALSDKKARLEADLEQMRRKLEAAKPRLAEAEAAANSGAVTSAESALGQALGLAASAAFSGR